MRIFRTALFMIVVAVALGGIACSSDKKPTSQKQPEIIGSTGGTAARAGASAPELLASSGASVSGGISLSPLNGPASASPRPPGGLTVTHTELATLTADQAAVVVTSVPRPVAPGPFPSL